MTAHADPVDAVAAQALFSRSVVFAADVGPATVLVEGGRIAAIERDRHLPGARDLGADMLLPGLVELHTDHLEPHVMPRPGVRWNGFSAVLAYDAQVAAAGMTTVFDCLRAGSDAVFEPGDSALLALGADLKRAKETGALRAEHHTHLRCEICMEHVLVEAAEVIDRFDVRLISLMDHTPGARQFRDEEKLRDYYRGKMAKTEAELDAFFAERRASYARFHDRHRRALVDLARRHAVTLASHDDTTEAHVAESIADGVAIAEFPTTLEAARASHAAGVRVLMGAPNVVRGGSHSGNVSAIELAHEGLLDILSSDYVPASLLHGAFILAEVGAMGGLAGAVRTVTLTPALAAGMTDRGEIAVGKRADLIRVATIEGHPVVREVLREGVRVL